MTRARLKAVFASKGLEFLGVTDLAVGEAFSHYEKWLDKGWHGEMFYLEQHKNVRAQPQKLLAGARTAIIFALNYDQKEVWPFSGSPRVAQYARFRDYHKTLREQGEVVAAELISKPDVFRVVVDSAPLFERVLASKTKHGFIGKNTCYIHPRKGSLFLLGEILTSKRFSPDEKKDVDPSVHDSHGGCGSCRECQNHCPTGALDVAYALNAKKCLSYWTIEHRGPIPTEYWPWLKYYYFGCDICQLVCPYNLRSDDVRRLSSTELKQFPSLFETATMNQRQYEQFFGGTPLTRAKRGGLIRNALIAMYETRDPLLSKAMECLKLETEEPIKTTLNQLRSLS